MKKLLIIDLESTCHERGHEPPEFFSEIIEIGAVLLDIPSRNLDWQWQCLVKPVLFPNLSEFCVRLTTIRQAEIDAGLSLADGLSQLSERIAAEDYRFASWGNYDRNQFQRNCRHFAIQYPFGPWHLNLKAAFADWVREKPMGMASALAHLKIPLLGTHHRGLDDARNIARIASWMLEQGWDPGMTR